MRDLIAEVTDNASALTLTEPVRGRGERDRGDIKRAAQKRLGARVQLPHAGEREQSIADACDKAQTSGDITQGTGKKLRRDVPGERCRAVRAAGKAKAAAEREGRAHTLSDPDAARAHADLQDGLRDLIDQAVSGAIAPKRDTEIRISVTFFSPAQTEDFRMDFNKSQRNRQGRPETFPVFQISLSGLKKSTSLSGLKRSQIYALAAKGGFPRPAKLGSASRWSRHEVEAWVAARLAEREAPRAA